MTKELLLDLAEYLATNGYGVATGANPTICRTILPDSPDSCVAVIDYPGTGAFTNDAVNRSIQILKRDAEYETARVAIWGIFNLLDVPEKRIIYLPASRWSIITTRNPPFWLKKDESKRTIFAMNLGVVTHRDE